MSGFGSDDAFDSPFSGAFGRAAGAATPELRWTRDFTVLDAQLPWVDVERLLRQRAARWLLLVRGGGRYRYVVSADELWSQLGLAPQPADRSIAELLGLHEQDASTVLPPGRPVVLPDPLAAAAPSRLRFVEVDDFDVPLALGGLDVDLVPRITRGLPPAQPVPADDPFAGVGSDDPFGGPATAGPVGGVGGADPFAGFDRDDAFGLPQTPPAPAGLDVPAAAPAPAATPAEGRLDDEGTAPVRYPSIEPEGVLQAGATVTLLVDLGRQASASTEAQALRLESLPPTWETMPIGVTLVAAGITFEDQGRAQVVIRRNDRSIAARVRGSVDGGLQPGATIDVHAQFWQGRRNCGTALRRLTVGAAAEPVAPGPAADAAEAAPQGIRGQIAVDPLAAEPDLTVFITLFDPSQPGRMHWRMEMPDFEQRPAKLSGVIDLGQDPRTEAAALFKEFAQLKRGEHRERIEGFGTRLWKRAPPEFHAAYWALVDHVKPRLAIQFISADPHLPWELMRPSRPGETHAPLALRHAVARWIDDYRGLLRNRLPRGEVVVVAPRYSALATRLSKAEATAQAVLAEGGPGKAYVARPCPGTRSALLDLLERPPADPVALLFFTGHGVFNADAPTASALKLEQGASLAADDVDREEIALGRRDGTVVFFNACEVGATAGAIGEVGGWAGALAARRFRAFIAPLWAVDEEDAARVTLELIDRVLTRREPIGEALRMLREEHGATSPTFYSYILYGDVTARFAA